MTNIQKLAFTLTFIHLLGACSSPDIQEPLVEEKDTTKTASTSPESNAVPLCKYSTRKGIAELIEARTNGIFFVFIPGNVEFSIGPGDHNIRLGQGSEFKAIYEELIEGSDNCPKPSPQLIGLPH